ncbi:MAG: HDIG domain-containing protein [Bacteroidales bacterium]|jgi:putative nucleotidyltransferase with HDIG domain|nr:HDIG domain-containing protein [Bacteroidales bacterium]
MFKKLTSFQIVVKVGLFLAAAILIVLMLPRERAYNYEYQLGKPWIYNDLIAPISFSIYKSDAMVQADRDAVMKSRKLYFDNDTVVTSAGLHKIEKSLNDIWLNVSVNAAHDYQYYLQQFTKIYKEIMKRGVIETVPELDNITDKGMIVVLTGNRAQNSNILNFYTIDQAYHLIDQEMESSVYFETQYMVPIIKAGIAPNIRFNRDITEKTLQQQLSNISLTSGAIQSGQSIINKGEIVTDEKARILESYQKGYEEQVSNSRNWVWTILGQSITAILSLLVLALYLYLFKKEVFWSNKNITLVLSVIVMMLFMMTIAVKLGDEYVYAVPICLAPLLVTTFFGARTAIFAHIATLLNVGFIVVNGFEFMFIQLLAGIITIFSILRLHKRVQVLKMMILVFPTYVVAHFGFMLIKNGTPDFTNIVDTLFYFACSSGLLIISYPLTYVFERIFGLLTDITLVEISDTNNKLLRELSTKAPGTFQHSNQVANLAEEAAYTIDANPMLTRAGAWYHDIGKINNPIYFTENQMNEENPYDKLSYEESARIITNHVKNGVEIAKKNHLPPLLIDFIKMHHGNRKTGYFYQKAKNEGKLTDESVYTYPGPIPNSKETALVMMADSVEAASRSLKNPNEQNISDLVDKIIDGLVAEHQFDNTNITMANINTVKKLFKKRLMNIYHVRIEYPEEKK